MRNESRLQAIEQGMNRPPSQPLKIFYSENELNEYRQTSGVLKENQYLMIEFIESVPEI
jgi:hypothetical protein